MYPSPPPHERAWRHPSELGAPTHEPTTTGGRMLILTTATLSLLLVGLLAISMTPERTAGTPEAVSSTVSGVRAIPAAALTRVSMPMLTPVGDDGMAVTTLDALAGSDQHELDARLPSGQVVHGEVVATAGGLALVELPAAVELKGLELAEDDPMPDDTVMVHAAVPVVVSVGDIDQLQVDEGTPATDAEGRLVGLCTGEDEMRLRPVDSLPATPPEKVDPVSPPATAASATATATVPTVAGTGPTAGEEPGAPTPTAASGRDDDDDRGPDRGPSGGDRGSLSGDDDASDGPG